MNAKSLLKLYIAFGFALPSLFIRFSGIEIAPVLAMGVFGGAILCSSFLLAWGAEAIQVDISAGFAIAILAFIAVLPEYAVDLYFAYSSGVNPEFTHFAVANMTGGNRLLIGIGWPLVALVYVWSTRKERKSEKIELKLEFKRKLELGVLIVAGLYAFIISYKNSISILDGVLLLAWFGFYLKQSSKEEAGEPHLLGVAEDLATLSQKKRRITLVCIFIAAAGFILASAEPFAHALIDSGKALGIDEFLLVQWLAPLASEAPEFIVAILLALRGKSDLALGTLLSSKVNQWTLLVGSIPIARFFGGGGTELPFDHRQHGEFFLTAAQTFLGFAFLANLKFSIREAGVLFLLFMVQPFFPQTEVRLGFAWAYLVIGVFILLQQQKEIRPIFGKWKD